MLRINCVWMGIKIVPVREAVWKEFRLISKVWTSMYLHENSPTAIQSVVNKFSGFCDSLVLHLLWLKEVYYVYRESVAFRLSVNQS